MEIKHELNYAIFVEFILQKLFDTIQNMKEEVEKYKKL